MFRQLLHFRSILFILLGLSSGATAQNLTKHDWSVGEVILTDGDTLKGAVSYYFQKELIQVKNANGFIQTFSPVNVTHFRVFNEQRQEFQTFRPFRYAPNPEEPTFKTPAFFEVVTEGKYTLIKRSCYVIRNLDPVPAYATHGQYYESYSVTRKKSDLNSYQLARLNAYFLYTPENKLIPLRHPKKNLEDLYQDKSVPMKAFIRQRNLSYKNPVALTRVVQYFNHL
ncbi:hypothetical protein [Adhaeribacter pallidiroseus]|uniref:DUF3857 domain-containing protein n=1 Tax=Adhaeribacter pallidiroseus TaxID=2072847 RepID=A0A369QC92_9BACT|nr:hypothetical protein [Adhaeribacter pallidiroseus]RDC62511.1 hypothetical protein AHMF7616_01105 [Adhaeribacter pallidiroseus]